SQTIHLISTEREKVFILLDIRGDLYSLRRIDKCLPVRRGNKPLVNRLFGGCSPRAHKYLLSWVPGVQLIRIVGRGGAEQSAETVTAGVAGSTEYGKRYVDEGRTYAAQSIARSITHEPRAVESEIDRLQLVRGGRRVACSDPLIQRMDSSTQYEVHWSRVDRLVALDETEHRARRIE